MEKALHTTKDSAFQLKAKIEMLYRKVQGTKDPESIREYGKQIVTLEARLKAKSTKNQS